MAKITEALGLNAKDKSRSYILALVVLAFFLTVFQYLGLLPSFLHRLPATVIPDTEYMLDTVFNFVKDDLGLLTFTRFLTEGLQWLLDVTGNLLYGKRRWPNVGPIP